MLHRQIPDVTFKTRVRDNTIGGNNPFRWENINSSHIFENRKILVFSLPGAFTPTCSTFQLPDFENLYEEFKAKNIDDIYVISVNDAFVMNKWIADQNIKKIKSIPDGSGEFTRKMGMLVDKSNLGFGMRSWRYAMMVDNKVITKWFEEPGFQDNCESDPYGETSPQHILANL